MKLFLVQTVIFDFFDDCDNPFDNSYYYNAYSSFELAKEEGIKDLKNRIKDIENEVQEDFDKLVEEEKLDYSFEITQIDDLQYAENFDIDYDIFHTDEYNKLEPTHKVYNLDYKGNILYIMYEYRYKNSLTDIKKMIEIYPQDLEEGASEKFKIGDIVKLKHKLEPGEHYIDDNMDRIYVVRWLPRKFNGEKYFENKYALISLYETDYNQWGNKELFTFEYWEKDIEKYTGEIERDSEYDLLSRIVNGNIKVSRDYWNKIKIGQLPLTKQSLKEENGSVKKRKEK